MFTISVVKQQYTYSMKSDFGSLLRCSSFLVFYMYVYIWKLLDQNSFYLYLLQSQDSQKRAYKAFYNTCT